MLAIELLLPAALALHAGFERIAEPVEVRGARQVRGPDGVHHLIHAGELVRRRDGAVQALSCTLPSGPGRVLALARHPGGTVFAATTRGVFATSPEVDALDPLEFYSGVPGGAPVGLALLGENRLWIATSDAFACADTAQLVGRTLRAEDGVPPPPYSGLRAAPDGDGLLLVAADGVYRYRPERGPPPRLEVHAVEGRPHEPGAPVALAAGGALRLALEGRALGGATFAWRPAGRHVWTDLSAGADGEHRIEGLEPGPHELHVVACDRDLRRSEPAVLRVDVAFPRALSPRVLVPLALGAALAVWAGFLGAARRRGGGRERLQRATLSAVVAVLLGAQLVAAAFPHARAWPFVGFAMYTERHERGELTHKTVARALMADGAQAGWEPYDAAYGLYEFKADLARVVHGDGAQRDAFLRRLQGAFPGAVGFALLDERQRLTERGPVPVAPRVLCLHPPGVLDGSP